MRTTRKPTIRPITRQEWMEWMDRGEGDWLTFDAGAGDYHIVERDGKLLAYLQQQPHEHQSAWRVIDRIETRPYYRRRGYARALIEQVRELYQPAAILAHGVQASALGFWERIGFAPDEPVSRRLLRMGETTFVWKAGAPPEKA